MEAFQIRVIEEKAELDSKREKLHSFFNSDIFKKLPDLEKADLFHQCAVMTDYSMILSRRIARFQKPSEVKKEE